MINLWCIALDEILYSWTITVHNILVLLFIQILFIFSLTCHFFVFQEVTLHRQSIEEKVGLTLCYGAADDEVTDIFIGEVRRKR